MAIKQPYIVLKQEPRFSKVYGTPMTKITLIGVKDRLEYITYIDGPNRNHANWQHIIKNPEHGFVLRNLNVKANKDKNLINADSEPIIEWEDDNNTAMMNQLYDIWTEEDRRNGSDKFGDLFE